MILPLFTMTVLIVLQETDSLNQLAFGWHLPMSFKSTELFDSPSSFSAECCQQGDDNYFNRRYFQLNNKEISFTTFIDEENSNRNRRLLREYSSKDVVRCLDSLSAKRNQRPIHIAFIGDSTIRQHYVMFLRVNLYF